MILSSQTIATTSFRERVEAAAAAGFSGLGLRPKDYARARAEELTDRDLRALLATHGLAVVEHQALRDWATGPTSAEDELFAVADALGGTYVIATATTLPEPDEAARQLARLAARAAEHGLVVALEFMPWSDVRDARSACELVEACGHPSAGILVDSWHTFRGGGALSDLHALSPESVVAVHLADADEDVIGTLAEDTLSRRRIPGEGDLPLVDFVRALDDARVIVDIAVEVLSDEQRSLTAREAARRAADGASRVIASARSRSG